MSGPVRWILFGVLMFFSGCAHSSGSSEGGNSGRFTVLKRPQMSLELKGSEKRRLFGLNLPCKLALGEVLFKARPLKLLPVELELSSGAGVRRSGLHSMFLGGRLSWSTRIAGCLRLAVNYSTLLAYSFPGRTRLGFSLGGVARLDL